MAEKLKIYTYGRKVLRKKASPVATFDKEIRALARAMLDTMHESNGIGLAAQQVGETVSLCTVDLPVNYDVSGENGLRLNPHVPMPLVLINPAIISSDGAAVATEGCLSFPEISIPVKRAFEVLLSFQDTDGAQHEFTVRGMLARVIQHEMDHLDGVLFIDRISVLRRTGLLPQLKKLEQAAKKAEKC